VALYNFDRAYELSIGKPPTYLEIPSSERAVGGYTISGDQEKNISVIDFRKVLNAVKYTTKDNSNPLHIEADIQASSDTSGTNQNTATIRLFNISEDSLNVVKTKNNFVILKAGYKFDEDTDSLPIIFSGQVESSNIWDSNGISSSEDSIRLFVPLTFQEAPSEVFVPRGWAFVGYLRDAMDQLCEAFNYVWYIVNGELYIHPKGYDKFVILSKLDRELLKSFRENQDSGESNSKSTDNPKSGTMITTFLDGRLKIGSVAEVELPDSKKLYNIKEVKHKLSYEGQVWDTIFRGESKQ